MNTTASPTELPATPGSPFRLAVVIEYPNQAAAPAIGKQECLGGMIVALQFNDALKELEVMRETLEHLRDRTSCTSMQYEMIDEALDWANENTQQPRNED